SAGPARSCATSARAATCPTPRPRSSAHTQSSCATSTAWASPPGIRSTARPRRSSAADPRAAKPGDTLEPLASREYYVRSMSSSEPGPAARFKHVFRDHPLAVTIITAITPGGPVGLTASSVSSVAVDPPAVSFSVTRATGTAGALLRADNLQIHFVAPEHVATAGAFARTGGERLVD